LTTYANNAFALPEAQRDPAAAKTAWDEIAPALDVLEIALGRSRWLAGDDFTVADLNVAAAMYRALFFDLTKWPHVHEWLRRCWERPAGKRVRATRE
jgi:glutathione S-transferase